MGDRGERGRDGTTEVVIQKAIRAVPIRAVSCNATGSLSQVLSTRSEQQPHDR